MKTKLRTTFLFVLVNLLFVSCQNDFEEETNTNNSNNLNSKLKSYYISGANARKVAGKLSSKLGKTISSKNTTFQMQRGTEVVFDNIMVVENEFNHISYSLKVESNSESENTFQNLVYIEKESGTTTKLITYQMTPEFANSYHNNLKSIREFQGTVTISTLSTPDCCGTPGNTVIVFPGSGGTGDPSSGSGVGTYNPGSGTGGATGGWGISIVGGSSGGGTSGTSSNTLEPCPNHSKDDPNCDRNKYGGGTQVISNRMYPSFSSGLNSGTPPELCCIEDIGIYEEAMSKKDCEKFKKLINANPTIKSELMANYAKTNMTTEQGFSLSTGSSQTVSGVNNGNAGIEFTPPPSGQKMKMMHHTHNSPANSTYSIYSWEDLESMSQIANNNQLDNEFISFLSTADGTNYAFTITDMSKFKKLFSSQNWGTPDFNQGMNTIIQTQREIYYYSEPNDGSPEIIQATNNDNRADALAFLQMLKELDCGITLFEVDPTFSSFTRVKLDPNDNNNIIPEPCN